MTVQGAVKEQQPDGMSHRGRGSTTRSVWYVADAGPRSHNPLPHEGISCPLGRFLPPLAPHCPGDHPRERRQGGDVFCTDGRMMRAGAPFAGGQRLIGALIPQRREASGKGLSLPRRGAYVSGLTTLPPCPLRRGRPASGVALRGPSCLR